jgi:hypothetical protein
MTHPTGRGGHDPLPTGTWSGFRPRPARGIAAIAISLLALAAAPAGAVTVIVPDDWPTIQQAIDSGADEILVRPGVYSETPVIAGNLPPDAYDYGLIVRGLVPVGTSPDSIPVVAGLVFEDLAGLYTHSPSITIADLKFSRAVENRYDTAPYSNPLGIGFTRCVLDSGLTDAPATVGGQLIYGFIDCRVEGPIWLQHPQQVYILDCVVHAPVTLLISELAEVKRTRFKGPGVFAIDLWGADFNEISNCTFEGFETPIRYGARPSYSLLAKNNVFIGPGIVPIRTVADVDVSLLANRISGFEVGLDMVGRRGYLEAYDNLIEDCGTALRAEVDYADFNRNVIRSCGAGVTLLIHKELWARGNIVQGCGGDGMVVEVGSVVMDSNVVGRCRGAGIRLTTGNGRLTANTSYGNAESGLVVTTTNPNIATSVDHNISHGNGHFGLEASGLGALVVSCNNWFANAGGPVSGIAPTSTDVTLDPLFCDVTQDDVHLSAGSPLLNAAGCGQIGALGQGCAAPIVSRLTTFTAASTVEGVEVRWQVADAAPGFVAWLERAEAATGPWARVECERASDGDLTVEYDRTAAPARSYWYRLVATDRGVTRALGELIRVETAPPTRFALLGTGPNPSPGAFEATFQLAHAADITLEFFDAQGRRVATIARGKWPAGIHRANWGGAKASPGVYLVRYRHPGGEDLRRIAVVR